MDVVEVRSRVMFRQYVATLPLEPVCSNQRYAEVESGGEVTKSPTASAKYKAGWLAVFILIWKIEDAFRSLSS